MKLTTEEKSNVFSKIINILAKYHPTDSALDDINKPKSVLKRELNLDDSKSKFGLETFILLYEHLPNDIKAEVKSLLDKVIFEVDIPDIVVRKRPGRVVTDEEPIVVTQSHDDALFEPAPYEPIGKMYTHCVPTGTRNDLPIHKEKRKKNSS